ncbi:MAG: hypothetical protein Q9214_007525, partial [Letrouitia sp. 1 TL-2023]
MAPSQLKQLRSSLKEQGVVGPQKSKKQKKRAVKDGRLENGRFRRSTAIQHIRDQFNPFENRAPPRAIKHDTVNSTPLGSKAARGSITRPGIARSIGEET